LRNKVLFSLCRRFLHLLPIYTQLSSNDIFSDALINCQIWLTPTASNYPLRKQSAYILSASQSTSGSYAHFERITHSCYWRNRISLSRIWPQAVVYVYPGHTKYLKALNENESLRSNTTTGNVVSSKSWPRNFIFGVHIGQIGVSRRSQSQEQKHGVRASLKKDAYTRDAGGLSTFDWKTLLPAQHNAWQWTDIKSLEYVCLSVRLCVCVCVSMQNTYQQ